jgi:hypothetical protein
VAGFLRVLPKPFIPPIFSSSSSYSLGAVSRGQGPKLGCRAIGKEKKK